MTAKEEPTPDMKNEDYFLIDLPFFAFWIALSLPSVLSDGNIMTYD
jgi:hypothetical protein